MWRPTGSLEFLKARARLTRDVRSFFEARGVLEIETPLLGLAPVTDLYLDAFSVEGLGATRYLQTSPEYAMKRLLAAGSGSIYQLGKAFRKDELGRYHLPEFTLLEWYRLGMNDWDLMDEVDDLLACVLKTPVATRVSYQDAFLQALGFDPHTASLGDLQSQVEMALGEVSGLPISDRDTCLQLLMSECVEPHLAVKFPDRPVFVYDYPASQSALAQIKKVGTLSVAARFEVFYQRIELGNGYFELQDASLQRQRFESDIARRQQMNRPVVPIDTRLLEALEIGFPECAGIAIGFDRLVMLAVGAASVADVVAFAEG